MATAATVRGPSQPNDLREHQRSRCLHHEASYVLYEAGWVLGSV